MVFEKARLQDLQEGIDIWEKDRLVNKIERFMLNPLAAFNEHRRQLILKELRFEEKQLLEKIAFLKELKKERKS